MNKQLILNKHHFSNTVKVKNVYYFQLLNFVIYWILYLGYDQIQIRKLFYFDIRSDPFIFFI